MKHIVTTIPKSKYATLEECELALSTTDGEDGGFWLINTSHLPVFFKDGYKDDMVCYMVYDGYIRGYFNIVDVSLSENYRKLHRIGKRRTTKCIVMANWHPIKPVESIGFQGWRYTTLTP